MILTNRFLEATTKTYQFCEDDFLGVRPRAICRDGFNVSIQVGRGYNATPDNDYGPYTRVELGYPIYPDKLLMSLMKRFGIPYIEELLLRYAEDFEHPTETIYKQVPVRTVDKLLRKHGGIVAFEDENFKVHPWKEEKVVNKKQKLPLIFP